MTFFVAFDREGHLGRAPGRDDVDQSSPDHVVEAQPGELLLRREAKTINGSDADK